MRKKELEGFIAGYRDVISGLLTTHDLPTKRWLRGYDKGKWAAHFDRDPFAVTLHSVPKEKR